MKPRWYQSDAESAAWTHLCTTKGNPLIVLPTGGGKSLVIAMTCHRAVKQFQGRVIVLQHRKELIVQNAEKLRALEPSLDIGIYSAGLNARDLHNDVIFAGIQSIYKRAHELGTINLAVIDEAHLVPMSGDGQYLEFLRSLQKFNPNLRVIGLTATPYRTGQGSLISQLGMFQNLCYSAPIRRLIDEGFLSELTTLPAANSVDTSGLTVRGGEFVNSEMEALFTNDEKIEAACREIVDKTVGRQSILVFCPGVAHAEKTAAHIQAITGEFVEVVTGNTTPLERAASLRNFASRQLRWLVNIDVLTTGFDAPCIDAIAVLRATMSPGLFAQVCGRGFRLFPGKSDCLILDFGQNIERHGPLDAESYGQVSEGRRGNGDGEAPQKQCPICGKSNPISTRQCECGYNWPPAEIPHDANASRGAAIFEKDIQSTRWTVTEISVTKHFKRNDKDAPPTFRLNYTCEPPEDSKQSFETVSEWVCIEHPPGFAQKKARLWWEAHSLAPFPQSVDEAIDLWQRGALAMPTHIETKPDGDFLKIVSQDLDPKPETWADEDQSEPDAAFDAFDAPDDVPF